ENHAAPPPSASPARGTLTVAARPPPPRGAGRRERARWGDPARRDERPMTESHDPFDEKAATWDDDPAKVERARVVADALRDAVPLGPTTRLLEYGAGTGLVTQALRDAVGPVTLADTSAGMRAVMQRKVETGALAGRSEERRVG